MSQRTDLLSRLPEIRQWLLRRVPLDLSMLVLDYLQATAADVARWPRTGPQPPAPAGHANALPAPAQPAGDPVAQPQPPLREQFETVEHLLPEELRKWIEQKLMAAERRGAAGRRSRAKHSARLRSEIEQAAGAIPPRLPQAVSVIERRLLRAGVEPPDRRVIRSTLRERASQYLDAPIMPALGARVSTVPTST